MAFGSLIMGLIYRGLMLVFKRLMVLRHCFCLLYDGDLSLQLAALELLSAILNKIPRPLEKARNRPSLARQIESCFA